MGVTQKTLTLHVPFAKNRLHNIEHHFELVPKEEVPPVLVELDVEEMRNHVINNPVIAMVSTSVRST